MISKEIITEYIDIYEKAIKQINDESKKDPPTDPYRSHYHARNLLLNLKKTLTNDLVGIHADETDTENDELKYKTILAFVSRDLGRIYVFTGETAMGEQLFQECLKLVESFKLYPEAVIPHIGALNELGVLEASRHDYKKAYQSFSLSEDAYKGFKLSGAIPLDIREIFCTPDKVKPLEKGISQLESLYTHCSFYLAQVFRHLGEVEKSANYCHQTLCRQLQAKNYDPVDFALNAATLSQYYIEGERFNEARHHLAAATSVMTNYKKEMLTPEMSEQEQRDITETFTHRSADVDRCWAKYGLYLLQSSKRRLLSEKDVCENELTSATKRLHLADKKNIFPDFELSSFENRVTCDYCLTFDDAKQVFHFTNDCLDQAKEYYKVDTDASEYAKIIKDKAECFEIIAFFEENPENQAKMHKKRAKYYEDLLEVFNPVFYMNICRECWYGAGTAFTSILDIKLDNLQSNSKPCQEEIRKINLCCLKAIKNFIHYVKSYTEKNSDKWRTNMDIEEQRTMLYAHFHIGRLYYKLMSSKPLQQLENLNNCLKYYKLFVEECELRKEASSTLLGEVGVCREMVNLLPIKIANMERRLENE